MKKNIILLSLAILLPFLSNAQDFWQSANGPYAGYIRSLAINSSGHIFAGTYSDGVFLSTNNGDDWASINTGLTNNGVSCLAINPGGHIFAGTAGGGVYRTIHPTTAVNEIDKELSFSCELKQNYPNPFNSLTTIKYSLARPDFVTIKIYSLSGQEIQTLMKGHQAAGEYQISWAAEGYPSGVYFYRLQTGEFSETKKLILQK